MFYKKNIAVGATAQSFYMTYGGTNWGWLGEPENYTSYDYGAAIRETRQLDPKYYEDKLIGYLTQSVARLTKTDPIQTHRRPTTPAIVDTARMQPRHRRPSSTCCGTPTRPRPRSTRPTSRSTSTPSRSSTCSYTYDDADPAAAVHRHLVARRQPELHRRRLQEHRVVLQHQAGDSLTVPFTGTAVRWIGSKTNNHGYADVYLDGVKQATVDCSGSQNQAVLFQATGLTAGAAHPEDRRRRHPRVRLDRQLRLGRRDRPAAGGSRRGPTYPIVPQQPGTAITLNGRDSDIIVADYKLGDSQLQYSTSELMTTRPSAAATSRCSTATRAPTARPCCTTRRSRPCRAPAARSR